MPAVQVGQGSIGGEEPIGPVRERSGLPDNQGVTPLKRELERLYRLYNHRRYVHPDPLEFLYPWRDPLDREVVGLLAACLAYGRVRQILDSVAGVLHRLESPAKVVRESSLASLQKRLSGFRHRFTTGEAVGWLLHGAGRQIERHGSLQKCFCAGLKEEDSKVLPALEAFVAALADERTNEGYWVLPRPAAGSACKRLHLFLRWMVRRDKVDPGGWERVPASKLIVPLDVHMHRIGRALGWTQRKQAGVRAALDVTNALRSICPSDPLRYDFALTRLGIRPETDLEGFLKRCEGKSEVKQQWRVKKIRV